MRVNKVFFFETNHVKSGYLNMKKKVTTWFLIKKAILDAS
jgi:hypothetical protein